MSMLIVKDINCQRAGNYTCVVTNKYGSDHRQFTIIIFGKNMTSGYYSLIITHNNSQYFSKGGSQTVMFFFEEQDGYVTMTIHHLHISHNTPCLLSQILHNPLFFISSGYYSRPKRNWKQCLYKILRGQTRCILGYVQVTNEFWLFYNQIYHGLPQILRWIRKQNKSHGRTSLVISAFQNHTSLYNTRSILWQSGITLAILTIEHSTSRMLPKGRSIMSRYTPSTLLEKAK